MCHHNVCRQTVELLVMQGTSRQIHSVATHPSQPDKCASGGSNGTIAVWDLRFTSAPLAASTGKQNAGDVWQVNYFFEAQAATVCDFVIFQSKAVAHYLMLHSGATPWVGPCFEDDCTTIQYGLSASGSLITCRVL